MKPRKPSLYKKAITLRKQGFSYREMKREIPVSKSTLSMWCRGIELTASQHQRLSATRNNTPLIQKRIAEAVRDKNQALQWAESLVKSIDTKSEQSLVVMGAMLYWGEGTKLRDGGYQGVAITNTDPGIILVAMHFFRRILRIPESKFTALVRMDATGNFEDATAFWSQTTGIPRGNFKKPEALFLRHHKSLTRYRYGMCRVVINSVSYARKIDFLMKMLYNKWQEDVLR